MKRTLLIFLAAFAASCSSNEAQKLYLPPAEEKVDVNEPDASVEDFSPQVDILFVIDNSGSMSTYQNNLARNIGLFTREFLRVPIISYNIAAISTDNDASSHKGRFQGRVKVVNRQTPDAVSILQENLKMGINGSAWEKAFDSIYAALQPSLLAGHNSGFLRPRSALAIIILSDAEDQSQISADALHQYLVSLRGGLARKVFGFGALVTSPKAGCSHDSGYPTQVLDFLSKVQNAGDNVMDLCGDFGEDMAAAAARIVDEVGNRIYLSRAPDPSTIRVTFGSMELPNDPRTGWTFNPRENSIVLGREIDWESQPADAEVKVFYTAANFKSPK